MDEVESRIIPIFKVFLECCQYCEPLHVLAVGVIRNSPRGVCCQGGLVCLFQTGFIIPDAGINLVPVSVADLTCLHQLFDGFGASRCHVDRCTIGNAPPGLREVRTIGDALPIGAGQSRSLRTQSVSSLLQTADLCQAATEYRSRVWILFLAQGTRLGGSRRLPFVSPSEWISCLFYLAVLWSTLSTTDQCW